MFRCSIIVVSISYLCSDAAKLCILLIIFMFRCSVNFYVLKFQMPWRDAESHHGPAVTNFWTTVVPACSGVQQFTTIKAIGMFTMFGTTHRHVTSQETRTSATALRAPQISPYYDLSDRLRVSSKLCTQKASCRTVSKFSLDIVLILVWAEYQSNRPVPMCAQIQLSIMTYNILLKVESEKRYTRIRVRRWGISYIQ